MPRSNWKGHISFGLVNIPIILFNSIDPSGSVSFKQINKKTGSAIKYKRVDAETEKEVPWSEIGKGYQYSKEVILPVEEGELEKVAGDNARTIAIEEFIDKKNINSILIDRCYYLVPDKKGEKGYVILREALQNSNKIGIAKVIISTREYLAAVASYQDALILYLLHYADEVRDLNDFNIPTADIKKYKVNQSEIEIAKKLINSMTAKWKPNKYKDEYKEAVEKWVERKANNLPTKAMPSRAQNKDRKQMVDFVALLKKSLKHKATIKNPTIKSKIVKKSSAHKRETIRH